MPRIPFQSLLRRPHGLIALVLLLAGASFFAIKQRQPCIPAGQIGRLEIAGTAQKADSMVAAWVTQCATGSTRSVTREDVVEQTRGSLTWDYGFIPFYAMLLMLGCAFACVSLPGRPKLWIVYLAWLQPVAGILDGLENLSLFKYFGGSSAFPWLRVAQVSAVLKFAIAGVGLFTALRGIWAWFRARSARPPDESVSRFNDVLAGERAQIDLRRMMIYHEMFPDEPYGPPTRQAFNRNFSHYSGIALSGGGIRSGTFCVGALQALNEKNLLSRFDYLSTVSGGGYIGAWWSAWISRELRPTIFPREEQIELSREAKYREGRPDAAITAGADPIHHLRLFSNHLTPRKGLLSADLWRAVTVIARNISLTWLALVPLALAAIMLGQSYYLTGFKLHQNEVRSVERDFIGARKADTLHLVRNKGDSIRVIQDVQSERAARLVPRVRMAVIPLLLLGVWFVALTLAWQLNGGGSPFVTLIGQFGGLALVYLAYQAIVGGATSWLPQHFWPVAIGSGGILFLVSGGLQALWPARTSVESGEKQEARIEEKREARLDAMRNLVARRQALILKTALVIAFVLGVAGFGHELVWYVMASDSPTAQWVKRSGGWLAALASAASGVFAAFRAAPSATGEQKSEPGIATRAVMVVAPVLFVLGLAIMLAVAGQWLLSHQPSTTGFASPRTLLGLAAFLFAFCAVYEAFTDGTKSAADDATWSTRIRHILRRAIAIDTHRTQFLYIVVAACVVCAILPFTAQTNNSTRPAAVAITVIAVCLAAVASSGWLIDPNLVALHTFYRGRIIRAFLGASNTARDERDITETAPTDDLRLTSLTNCQRGAPYHLVNTTLNLVGGRDLATGQRHAASFIFSQGFCGSLRTGYRPTKDYMQGTLTLGAAMAASGAAVAPNMGSKTLSAALSLLLAFFNVRLGLWVPTPNRRRWRSRQPGLWPYYLLRESLSQTTDLGSYCYLTDGGHFDNTGVYSLVERGCRSIVVLDCGADPRPCFSDIGDMIRRCRIDFGADIDLDVSAFVKNEDGEAEAHSVRGIIVYSEAHASKLRWRRGDADDDTWRRRRTGVIVWIKPTITARERADLRQYALENSVFPQQTTADQWFDEAQFESYRMLGERSARSAFANGFPNPDAVDDEVANWIRSSVRSNLATFENLGLRVVDSREDIEDVFTSLLRPSYSTLDADELVRPAFPRRRRDQIERAVDGIMAEAMHAALEKDHRVRKGHFLVPCRRARDTLWPLG